MNSLSRDKKAQWDHAVHVLSDETPVRVTRQNIKAFLEATRDIGVSAANRLRWLAIELESLEFEQGWNGLRAIYQTARDADPTDPAVLHSWGIAALQWSEEWMTSDLSERLAIAAEAEQVLQQALQLQPRDSRMAHTLGLLYYQYPSRSEDAEGDGSQAVHWFRRAVEWDPGNTIAQLYLGHCFHDLGDWHRAIAEYEKIDLDRLERDWQAWRAVKCREQLAQCYAYSGNRDEAAHRFNTFLDDVESWDNDTLEERIVDVDELVTTVTDLLDEPELMHRTRALVHRLRLENRYPQLLSAFRCPWRP